MSDTPPSEHSDNPFLVDQSRHEYRDDRASERKNDRPTLKDFFIHSILFILTFFSVSIVSTLLVGKGLQIRTIAGFSLPFPTNEDLIAGALFASLLLSFLTVHEFGHYFAALYHRVRVSLPYFIPLPVGIGTLGAVIKIRQRIQRTRSLFDIGAAGPVAGFVVSLIILIIGFTTLPGPSFLNEFGDHQMLIDHFNEFGYYPPIPSLMEGQMIFLFGETPLYSFIASFFPSAPPMYEIMHYPFLLAGWFGLFFTALNLMPVGQLDGGHILYSLVGYEKHRIIARLFFGGLTVLAGIEAIPLFQNYLTNYGFGSVGYAWGIWIIMLSLLMKKAYKEHLYWMGTMIPISLFLSGFFLYVWNPLFAQEGSVLWIFWSFFTAYVVKIEHPPVRFEEPLSPARTILGWLSMVIFILCISLNPLTLVS
jgi:membrane-associated protease RseP (regulator of RpoE activity)